MLQIGIKMFLSLKKFRNCSMNKCNRRLNSKAITGTFYKKKLQKANQKEFRIEKVIKRKSDKLYVNWKVCDNSVSSWIDKKDTVI